MPSRPALRARASASLSGIGGSVTAAPDAPANPTAPGGILDPNQTASGPPPVITHPPPTSTQSTASAPSDVSPSSTPTASPAPAAQSGMSATTIIIIGSVATVAVILFFALLFFCRRRKRQPRPSRGSQRLSWQMLSAGRSASPDAERKAALYRDAPHPPVPIMLRGEETERSFLTMKSNQSLPTVAAAPINVPQLREPQLREPQLRDPPIRRPSGDYAASYFRSLYGSDSQSVVSDGASTRTGGERRSVLRKSRSNKELNKELIAMEKLIAALDLSAEEERRRQLAADDPEAKRDSYVPSQFPLPPPAVFRAALGGHEWEQ